MAEPLPVKMDVVRNPLRIFRSGSHSLLAQLIFYFPQNLQITQNCLCYCFEFTERASKTPNFSEFKNWSNDFFIFFQRFLRILREIKGNP
jgi:hypothetical protein